MKKTRHEKNVAKFLTRDGRYGAGAYDCRVPTCGPKCFQALETDEPKPVCPLARKRNRTLQALAR